MPFVVQTTRKFTYVYEENDEKFEADFEWLGTEDSFDSSSLALARKYMDKRTEGKQEQFPHALSIVYNTMRRSLKAVRGMVDTEGNEIQITSDDIQKAVFEFILKCGDAREVLRNSYLGITSKNLKPGATQSSTQDGDQKSA